MPVAEPGQEICRDVALDLRHLGVVEIVAIAADLAATDLVRIRIAPVGRAEAVVAPPQDLALRELAHVLDGGEGD